MFLSLLIPSEFYVTLPTTLPFIDYVVGKWCYMFPYSIDYIFETKMNYYLSQEPPFRFKGFSPTSYNEALLLLFWVIISIKTFLFSQLNYWKIFRSFNTNKTFGIVVELFCFFFTSYRSA